MQDEPLPHEKLPGAMEEWQYDTANNPKAVSRHRVAEQMAQGSGAFIPAGDGGLLAIFVMPFVIGVTLVGLAFMPFFWIGIFFDGAGWSFASTAKVVAVPIMLWAALLVQRKFTRQAVTASRRPYQHESTIRALWRKTMRVMTKGRPASLGDALMIGFAVVFGWLVFSGQAESLERVGPAPSAEGHVLMNLGLDAVNLPLVVVHSLEKIVKEIKGIKTLSIPLFLVALNSLFYAAPLVVVIWPALRIVQRLKR